MARVLEPELIVLPIGSFVMGSSEEEPWRNDDEGPQHAVAFDYQFAIAKLVVTFDEWDKFASDQDGCRPDDGGAGRGVLPVVRVSWEDAQKYIFWLNSRLGIALNDPCRFRLPTEAGWEYACKAGGKNFGLKSKEDADQCNVALINAGDVLSTSVSGAYPLNAWGLNDMLGNVWEWVQDNYNKKHARLLLLMERHGRMDR